MVMAWLDGLPALAIYAVAAVLVAAETALIIGLVLPGEVTLVAAGFLAYTGVLRPVPTAIVLIAAAVAGDAIGYAEGRRNGPRLRASRLGRWVGDHRWSKADALFARHGGRAILLGRHVAFARTLMPRLAAIAGLPYRRLLPWNLAGIATQVGGALALGYLAGTSYEQLAHVFGRATGAVLLLLLIVGAMVAFGRYLGRHPDPVTAIGDRIGNWGPLRLLDRAYDAGFRWLTAHVGVGGAVAASLLLGVGLVLAVGAGLTWAIDALIATSGLPLIDSTIADWIATLRNPALTDPTVTLLSVLRGSYLVIATGVAGLLISPWPDRWRADVLGVLGTVGAFLPLVILAVAADWVRPGTAGEAGTDALFPNQVTLVTASLGMVAWLITRRRPRWEVRVAAWVTAATIVILVSAGRVYVGWNWPSEILASTLLGALWVVVFASAWRTRDRVTADDSEKTPEPAPVT
ncbi:VTT domain-containing protein [Luedemannella helvata]